MIERVHVSGGRGVRGFGGVSLGRVFSGLITTDRCNLQVDSREKSARFTLPWVSICRHYAGGGGGASARPGRVGRRDRKRQTTNKQARDGLAARGSKDFPLTRRFSRSVRVSFAAAATDKMERGGEGKGVAVGEAFVRDPERWVVRRVGGGFVGEEAGGEKAVFFFLKSRPSF